MTPAINVIIPKTITATRSEKKKQEQFLTKRLRKYCPKKIICGQNNSQFPIRLCLMSLRSLKTA
jgi:hypothetical protein